MIICAAAFVLTAALLTGLMVLAASIPRESIRENMLSSAEYLCEGELFGTVLEGVNASRIDRYADSILLAIAWQLDPEKPLESVVRSEYFYRNNQNENENLLEAVTEGLPPNRQYLRYWHGSIAFITPLLCVMPLAEIYKLNGVLLTVLTAGLLALLIRRKYYAPAWGTAAGLIAAGIIFVPLSLEYTWVFIIALAVSLAVCLHPEKRSPAQLAVLFMISGMLTSFMDFLTAETVTLLMPLLLLLWLQRRTMKGTGRELLRTALTAFIAWGFGYAGMWMLKWLLASLVMHENVLPYVSGHIAERLYGETWQLGPAALMWNVLVRNTGCLFPLGYGPVGAIAGWLLAFYAVYYGYVYLKPGFDKSVIRIYAAVGLVPFLRYLVLCNHSYLHYFFSYRALAATILAVWLILEELTERRGRRV
jgi:hypothetical protein